MTIYNQMPFPPHQGLPFDYAPPLVDGFVEPDPGVSTTQLDPGYTGGPRFAFGGSSGVPMAVFEGIKNKTADTLYMGFIARYDPGFDGKDFVMVVLQPSPGAPSAADRRIDVYPNAALSAGSTSSAGAPAAPPDANDVNPSGPGLPQIRTNKPPTAMTVYQRTPGGPNKWAAIAEPAGMACKVRSTFDGTNRFWSVELQIPTTGWMTLSSTFGLYFDIGVGWTDGTGITYVVQYPWPYDPDNPTGNFLADPAGFSVAPENWDPPTYGQGLILAPGAVNPAEGVRFLGDALGIGVLDGAGNIGGTVNMAVGANNNMVARLQNTSPNTVPKVRARFRIAEFGISGGIYSHNAAWEDLPTPSTNPAPHAGVDIPESVGATGHQDITLNWHIDQATHDKFHPLSADQCLWVQLDTVSTASPPPAGQPAPAGPAVEFAEDSVRRNLWFTNLSTVQHKAALDASHLGLEHLLEKTHHVILQVATSHVRPVKETPLQKVLLAGGIEHVALRPAMQVAPILRTVPIVTQPITPKLTEPVRVAPTAPGVARPPAEPSAPAAKFIVENPILTGTIASAPLVKGIKPKLPPAKFATWFTAVNAYQVLGNRTLTYEGGSKAKIVAYVGSYGYVAQHALKLGETIAKLQLNHSLAGPNLKSVGPNLYRGTVAPKAKVQLTNTLRTVRISKVPIVVAKPIAALGKLIGR